MRLVLVRPCPVCAAPVRLMPVSIVDAEDDYPPAGVGVEVAHLDVCLACVDAAGLPVPSEWWAALGGQAAVAAAAGSMPREARRDRFYELAVATIARSSSVSLAG